MLESSHPAETTKRIGCPRPKDIFPIHSCVLGKARKIFWIDTVQTDESYSELCNGLSAIGYSRSAVKQNKYDEPEFFAEYSRMPRSIYGLAAAMEWAAFRALLPDLHNKRVLDLGCGFGWHCRYVHEHGATKVVGIDLSEKMLERARTTTNAPGINYHRCAIEDIDFPANEFDIVISSLALHYVESFDRVCHKIHHCLTPNGLFLFSVEHPIFTTLPAQDWYYSPTGERLHWPIDNYQREGRRQTNWLTENVIKYHRTMATYVNMLIQSGFLIKRLEEPKPDPDITDTDVQDQCRRPPFLVIAALKANPSARDGR